MSNQMLPIIRQMLDAESDQARARVLLAVPDIVLMRHMPVFTKACHRAGFDLGAFFIDVRRAEWHATRGPDGQIVNQMFAEFRAAFVAFAGVAP